MAETENIAEYLELYLEKKMPLSGKQVLVNAKSTPSQQAAEELQKIGLVF